LLGIVAMFFFLKPRNAATIGGTTQ
jgi:hypothetical protein